MDKKYLNLFAAIFILFISQYAIAQSPSDVFKAISTSNYSLLESYLGNEVDICIDDDQQLNNKVKAISRIKSFFVNHVVEKIEPLHNASKSKNSEFKVAKVITKSGIYRLFVYSETSKGKSFVKELRIEKF